MKIRAWQVVLVGLVMIAAGFALGYQGDVQQSRASVTIEMSSASVWGDVLGFEPSGGVDEDMAQAQKDFSAGQTKSLLGWSILLLGAATLLIGAPLIHRSQNRRPSAARTSALTSSGPIRPAEVSVSRRPCPDCGELIAETARKCRYCGLLLP